MLSEVNAATSALANMKEAQYDDFHDQSVSADGRFMEVDDPNTFVSNEDREGNSQDAENVGASSVVPVLPSPSLGQPPVAEEDEHCPDVEDHFRVMLPEAFRKQERVRNNREGLSADAY